jgi:glycerol-3-phosphate acyltransferase PlsX
MQIAIDAMGGDFAPGNVIEGALAAARSAGIGLTFVGPEERIRRELDRHPPLEDGAIQIVEAPETIDMAEAPAAALRRKRHSSIRVAAELVARGEAIALFSAGNTGATVMAAHSTFGLLPGIDRPALATTIPTLTHAAVLLDSGANVECRPVHLVQFAAMGSIHARIELGISSPRVALLSNGEEESKGNDLTREAYRLLKQSPLNFIGNLEARDVYTGRADVIVCDGFTGNIALKISEGMVEAAQELLREAMSHTFSTRFGYFLSRRAFRYFRRRVDYAEYGGAPLLGVAGACIVGHGRSSVKAVRNAVNLASRFARQGTLQRIEHELAPQTTAAGRGPVEGSSAVS